MKLILLILTLFYINISVSYSQFAQPAPPRPDYDSILSNSTRLISNGEYAKASNLLKDFPKNDTSYATAIDKLNICYLGEEKWDEALKVSEQGLKLNSQYKRHFYEMYAAALVEKKEYLKAIEILEKGLKEFPYYSRFFYHMGVTYKNNKEYVKAEEFLRKSIQTNPFDAKSHFVLGQIMYNSNRMIPAMLSYHMFLMLDRTDNSLNVLSEYEKMGNGEYKSNPDSLWLKLPASVNNFQELEAIVLSKFALNSNYKTSIKLKYKTIVKTMQIIGEKLEYNKADTGFYMQFYVPMFIDMVNAKVYETSIYYNLRAIDDSDVQKEIKRQDGNISKLADHINGYLNKFRSEKWLEMKLTKLDPYFDNSGLLSYEGKYDSKSKINIGDFINYWPSGYIKNKGNFTAAGKMNGRWESYSSSGNLVSVRYYNNDLLSDSTTYYFTDGTISEVSYFQSDKTTGTLRTYHSAGGLKNTIPYDKGVRSGPVVFYHSNGLKKLETTLANDKLNGLYVEYYNNGNKLEEIIYINDLANGNVKKWYYNGKLSSEGNYKNGEEEGEWKFYNEEGYLSSSGKYKAGKESGPWKTFSGKGAIESELKYLDGKLEGESTFYDEFGKAWCVMTFSKGIIKKYKYFDNKGTILSEGAEKGGTLDLKAYYSSGLKFRERVYVNGIAQGKCTTWNIYGNIESVQNYKNDLMEGKQVYYYDSGIISGENEYKEGNLDGLTVHNYKNGVISKQGWYVNDSPRGTWVEYSPLGVVSETYFYQGGELHGEKQTFDINGKLEDGVEYSFGNMTSYTDYDTLGNVLFSGKLKNGSGSFNSLHLNKKIKSELNYKRGTLDGEIKRYFSNGKLRSNVKYQNGNANGKFSRFDWEGNPDEEGYYKDGYIDSLRIAYYDKKILNKAQYYRGDLHGERLWYHPNGNVSSQGTFVYDDQEGYFYFFADNGMLRYRLYFEDGVIKSYSYLAADSTFKPEILLPRSTGEVKTYYQNGNASALYNYNSGYFDGPFIQYYPNGNVRKESTYKLHEKEGIQKEFDETGKLVAEENYTYDKLHGSCKYYKNGIIQRELYYSMGWLNGAAKTYDNKGKLIKTVNMYNDEPFE